MSGAHTSRSMPEQSGVAAGSRPRERNISVLVPRRGSTRDNWAKNTTSDGGRLSGLARAAPPLQSVHAADCAHRIQTDAETWEIDGTLECLNGIPNRSRRRSIVSRPRCVWVRGRSSICCEASASSAQLLSIPRLASSAIAAASAASARLNFESVRCRPACTFAMVATALEIAVFALCLQGPICAAPAATPSSNSTVEPSGCAEVLPGDCGTGCFVLLPRLLLCCPRAGKRHTSRDQRALSKSTQRRFSQQTTTRRRSPDCGLRYRAPITRAPWPATSADDARWKPIAGPQGSTWTARN
ncbi:hypothetical protein BDV96DRAFT_629531 [Lophiotrema nucula]|uniref:Uncharacterized protein n=1 Tax=Lophiotrema nucula TaxID=690887 RepID=A0A6A5ZJC9_9PLEO|nr:hypothetical protein BDV96DRAFT_629531 [Lophiotrema nucula]